MTSRATASEPSATPLPDDSGNDPSEDPRDARIAELEAEVVKLRTDLWGARDAAIGATAEVGSWRVKIVELEALIHQLRTEMSLLGAGSGRRTPGYYVDRVARGVYRRIR